MHLIILLSIALSAPALAIPSRVLIIRHAEKPTDPNDPNLSNKGFQRAKRLVNLFNIHPEYASKGLPSFIFAAKYILGKNSTRSIQTITPLANSLHLPIQTPYRGSEADILADKILKSPALNGKVVLIAWVHGDIPALATALNGHCPKVWDGDQVFDRVWQIDYGPKGGRCSDLPQSLFPEDSNLAFQSVFDTIYY